MWYVAILSWQIAGSRIKNPCKSAKAANGLRTRDLKLGKLALYQLSYRRSSPSLRPLGAFQDPATALHGAAERRRRQPLCARGSWTVHEAGGRPIPACPGSGGTTLVPQ
jgi:hypothetical protein